MLQATAEDEEEEEDAVEEAEVEVQIDTVMTLEKAAMIMVRNLILGLVVREIRCTKHLIVAGKHAISVHILMPHLSFLIKSPILVTAIKMGTLATAILLSKALLLLIKLQCRCLLTLRLADMVLKLMFYPKLGLQMQATSIKSLASFPIAIYCLHHTYFHKHPRMVSASTAMTMLGEEALSIQQRSRMKPATTASGTRTAFIISSEPLTHFRVSLTLLLMNHMRCKSIVLSPHMIYSLQGSKSSDSIRFSFCEDSLLPSSSHYTCVVLSRIGIRCLDSPRQPFSL